MFGWLPLWFEGMPFSFAYQPALHYAVAWTSSIFHLSPAAAYHAVTAFAYSLGPVAVFFLLRRLSGGRTGFSFAGAMLYSLFSPSLLLVPAIARDAAGVFHAQRLHALASYGEGPNVTGLTLVPLALLLVDRWFHSRSRGAFLAAAVAIASVLITSWPSSVALALALICYTASTDVTAFAKSALRMALVSAAAYALACPFVLPSVMWTTFANANAMGASPVRNAKYYWSCALLAVAMIAARAALSRADRAIRFSALWSLLLAWIALGAAYFDISVLPQSVRFHLALEMALIVLVTLIAPRVLRTPALQRGAALALIAFCCFQFLQYRSYARDIIRRVPVAGSIEFRTASWLAANMPAARVFAPGSISFWMNAFTDNPQIIGCCDQSLINPQTRIAGYILFAGQGDEAEDAAISLLWLKAFGASAVIAGGPNSREAYKPYAHPRKFENRLRILWASGDDKIYQVPWRGDPFVRVVRPADVVRHAPVNGIDLEEIRRFVTALDDPSLPVASAMWASPERGVLRASLTPDEVLSVPINWHRGWSAQANGRPVPVSADGLGFLLISPGCSGECEVQLTWSPGKEVPIAIAVSVLTAALLTLLGINKPRVAVDR